MASRKDGHMQRYTPGEVADRTGFSLDTMRYYERIGLLDGVARDPAGRRIFTEADVDRLGLLRCLRATGMPIARMLRYAELARAGDTTLPERIALLEEHDREVERRIADLCAQRENIREKIRSHRSARRRAGT